MHRAPGGPQAPTLAPRGLAVPLAAALFLLAALAGCTSDPTPSSAAPPFVAVAGFAAGHAYAIAHAGGALTVRWTPGPTDATRFASGGQTAALAAGPAGATVEVEDGARLAGRLVLTAGSPEGHLGPLAATTLVLRIDALSGGLALSDERGAITSGIPLGPQQERVVLVQNGPADALALPIVGPPLPLPVGGLPGVLTAFDVQVAVNLTHVPWRLSLLTTAAYSGLVVDIATRDGPVFHAAGNATETLGYGSFIEIPGLLDTRALLDGQLNVTIHVDRLDGALILVSDAVSRAVPQSSPAGIADARGASPPFVFGALPEAPASFTVGLGTQHLWFVPSANASRSGSGHTAPPTVRLYDPTDQFLGVFAVPAGGVRVPILQAGTYVAIASQAQAVDVGADQAPPDFDLRELDVQVTIVGQAAGLATYGLQEEQVRFFPAAVPYALEPTRAGGPSVPPCAQDGLLEILQEGESLGRSLEGNTPDGVWANATARLGNGPLTALTDGFGDNCSHPAVYVYGYERS